MPLKSYKGFNADMTCRGFQFAVGGEYTHNGAVNVCNSGFHACKYPLDVLQYYEPGKSVYAEVEQDGELSKHGADSKVASKILRVKASLSLADLIKAAVTYTFARSVPEEGASATGVRGAASATGVRGAASATGVRGAASATGYAGAASATGDEGAASATGYAGAASATGDAGAASATGYAGAASATGYAGAASATGDAGAASATGVRGTASATGVQGAASATGVQGAASATGYAGAASATGYGGKVRGADGCALFLVERDNNYKIIAAAAAVVGKTKGIKPDTWYTLKRGEFTVVKD